MYPRWSCPSCSSRSQRFIRLPSDSWPQTFDAARGSSVCPDSRQKKTVLTPLLYTRTRLLLCCSEHHFFGLYSSVLNEIQVLEYVGYPSYLNTPQYGLWMPSHLHMHRGRKWRLCPPSWATQFPSVKSTWGGAEVVERAWQSCAREAERT